jgi:hypothetical protein
VAVRFDAYGREHGGIADHPAIAALFVAGIEQQIARLPEPARAPGLQLGVEQGRGAADLGGREAFQAELGHDPGGVAGGDPLHIHLGQRQHHRAAGPASALQGLRIERRLGAPALGHLDGDRPGRGVQGLGLVAIGIAPPLGTALIQAGVQIALAFQPHRQLEQGRERLRHAVRPLLDQLFHECGDHRILRILHPVLLLADRQPE